MTADRPEALPRGHDIDVFRADGNGWLHRLAAKWGTKKLHPHVAEWADTEHSVPVGEFTSLLEELDRFRSDMLGFWRGYDVIICPVTATPAFPHNESLVENPGHGLHYVGAFNLTGWPGAVVRGGTSAEGLPIGVQIVAPPWREEVALAVALRIESALAGWQPPPL